MSDEQPQIPVNVNNVNKKRNPRPRYTQEQVAEALRRAQGKQCLAAQMLGVGRSAVSMRIKRSKYLGQIIEDIWQEWIDILELDEYQDARKGPNRIKCRHFILTHHKAAKERGWGKRTEITGAGSGPLAVKMYDFDVSHYPPPIPD